MSGDLKQLLELGDSKAIAAFCTGESLGKLDDTTRDAVKVAVLSMLRGAWKFDNTLTAGHVKGAAIVGTALLTSSELSSSRWLGIVDDDDLAYELVKSRGLQFRNAWVKRIVDEGGRRGMVPARRLIYDGLAERPAGAEFTLGLVVWPLDFDLSGRAKTIEDVLRFNPDLLEHELWLLFRVEGGGDRSLANQDQFGDPAIGSWPAALASLAANGVLDRQRLLDESLSSLERGFKQYRARWYSHFHELLVPTVEERAARSVQYLRLTSSPVGPTVKMALQALDTVQSEGLLDSALVCEHIGSALNTKAKSSALMATKILAKAVAHDAALVEEAVELLIKALTHPARDVQIKAFKLIQKWVPEPSSELSAILRDRASGCHQSTQALISEWLGSAESEPETIVRPEIRRVRPSEVDWLHGDRLLDSGEISDELLTRLGSMLESGGKPEELELLLAAMAENPTLASELGGPAVTLGKRAERLMASTQRRSQYLIAAVVAAWLLPLDGESHTSQRIEAHWKVRAPWTPSGESFDISSLDGLVDDRFDELIEIFQAGQPAELLSTPTHVGGVIDPIVFAERLARVLQSGRTVLPADLQIALLRLAPSPPHLDQSRKLLRATSDVPDAVIGWMQQWADHCDKHEVASPNWNVTSRSFEAEGTTYHFHSLHIDSCGSLNPSGQLLLNSGTSLTSDEAAMLDLQASMVPGLSGVWSRLAAKTLATHTDTDVIKNAEHGVFLERYFDSWQPFGPGAHLALAIALGSGPTPIRTIATDLLVGTIEDGRCDTALLGRLLGQLTQTSLLIASRWARATSEAATASPGCNQAVAEILQSAVAATDPEDPKRILPNLELLENCLLGLGRSLQNQDAALVLEKIAGKSKTAQAARRLLELGARP